MKQFNFGNVEIAKDFLEEESNNIFRKTLSNYEIDEEKLSSLSLADLKKKSVTINQLLSDQNFIDKNTFVYTRGRDFKNVR